MGTLYKRSDHDPRTAVWYGAYTDHNGNRVKRSTRTRSKADAQQILNRWETQAALRMHGVIDAKAERMHLQGRRALSDHLGEFIASLESAGKSEVHTRKTKQAVEWIASHGGWSGLSDITAEDVESYGAGLRKAGRAARTIQRHLRSAKQFTRWCVKTGRIDADPLVTVDLPNPESDRRLSRRALLLNEWDCLLAAIKAVPERYKMPSDQRALLYELAIQTGLRASEIHGVTPGKFHLDRETPYVLLPAAQTKAKQEARQYISDALRTRLSRHIASRPSSSCVFDAPRVENLANMIRGDLRVARKAWEAENEDAAAGSDFLLPVNHEGKRLDFHSLRHTCGTWLAMRGENPKTIQTIMRHSTITLTMDRYGHLFPDFAANAVAGLGDWTSRGR